MDLTWISVADTAVKIGFGAVISALSGYAVLTKTQSHEDEKYKRERFFLLQDEKKIKYVELLAQSQELIQRHLFIDADPASEEYRKYLRTFNEVQIISNDEIRVAASKMIVEVGTFIFYRKDSDTIELTDRMVQIARSQIAQFQKIAQNEVLKTYE